MQLNTIIHQTAAEREKRNIDLFLPQVLFQTKKNSDN